MNYDKTDIETLINAEIEEGEKKYGKDFKLRILKILSYEKMLLPQVEQVKHSRKIPLSEWKKYHDYPTVRALRAYYYDKKTGFDYCVEHSENKQKRIIINEDKYFEWQENREKFARN